MGNFLHFIVGQSHAEFILINGFEFFDGLTTQLLWYFHVVHFTCRPLTGKDADLALSGMGWLDKKAISCFNMCADTGLSCSVFCCEVAASGKSSRLW